jgi:hypothetical protein
MQICTFARRLFCPAVCCLAAASLADEPIRLGHHRELFVDDFLIGELLGARCVLHHPVARELAVEHDTDWEGNTSGYHTVFQDGDLYRMYYRGSHANKGTVRKEHPQYTCYAESRDGIHWEKPNLGLFEFDGSKENNIVWAGPGTHNFAPFKDTNPDCPPEARYKALGGHNKGLVAFHSPDGIHWTLVSEEPVITKGAFDSQNLAFWDAERQRYVDFHRHFTKGVRAIMTCTSPDFVHWTEPVWLEYPEGTPNEHLYTNQITAYHRAPHIFMGFPKRFMPDRRMHGNQMPGLSDGVFMTSRDGLLFHRWGEAWIRPGLQRERWVNRNNMTAWGIVETESAIPGTPRELSVYSTEGYYRSESCGIRRYSLRLDGFVSVQAPLTGGTLVTKPFTFAATEKPQPAPAVEGPLTKTPDGQLKVDEPTYLSLPGTQKLGKSFTLSVKVQNAAAGHRRLFSAYDGGPIKAGDRELIVDAFFGKPSRYGDCVRFWYDGLQVSAKAPDLPAWSDMGRSEPLLVTATWQNGVGTLYLNGKQLAQAKTDDSAPVELRLGDLRFGEDYPPTSLTNEPFLGLADDILVLKRALSAEDVAKLATDGPQSVTNEQDEGLLYQADGPTPRTLVDALGADGDLMLPSGAVAWGDTQLLLNVSTSVAGSVRCELQTPDGTPIPGFTLTDCDILYGDGIELPVSWRGGQTELKELAGRPVRLKVELKDADLYAIRFGQPAKE